MKMPNLRNEKHSARVADRHMIVSPQVEAMRALWTRSITTLRVSDLFNTRQGLSGHRMQLQSITNQGNKNFLVNGQTDARGKELIKFISEAVEKSALNATFDFPYMELKFTQDMGWLKIKRTNKVVTVWSRP